MLDEIPAAQARPEAAADPGRRRMPDRLNSASNLYRRTMLMTLYATGARPAEMRRLQVLDIDGQRMIIHIRQGNGGRRYDFSANLAAAGGKRRRYFQSSIRRFAQSGTDGRRRLRRWNRRQSVRILHDMDIENVIFRCRVKKCVIRYSLKPWRRSSRA